MLVFIIYLLGMLDALVATLLIGIVALLLFWTIKLDCATYEERETILANAKKKIILPLLVLISGAVLIPSEETAYKMLAAYGVTEAYEVASQSEDVQRLAGKSLRLLEQTLDENLKEAQE